MKLALGTVQFGLKYGIANSEGQVPFTSACEILQTAQQFGIDTIDTAIGYGTSEQVLGQIGIQGWHVISKLPPLPSQDVHIDQWVLDQIAASLRRLGVTSLAGMLLHNPADLLSPVGEAYIRALKAAKADGLVRAIGVSIYSPQELAPIFAKWQPDLIQAPCSVLDRRLIQTGWLQRMREMGVRVHLRSTFLQGLLLMSNDKRPQWFSPWSTVLDRWSDWCREQGITQLEGALAYVMSLAGVERVVVGVDSLKQLSDIVLAMETTIPAFPDDLFCDDLNLIEPYRWKLT